MIKLTHCYNKTPIYIDPYKIAIISCYDKIATKVTMTGGSYCYVAESPEKVARMIEEAIG